MISFSISRLLPDTSVCHRKGGGTERLDDRMRETGIESTSRYNGGMARFSPSVRRRRVGKVTAGGQTLREGDQSIGC